MFVRTHEEDLHQSERTFKTVIEKVTNSHLELTKNIDEDASIKHWLTVNSSDQVLYLLECETSELLHDLGRSLHLLTFEGQQRLFSIV